MKVPANRIANRYELLQPAGEGGMAVVWKAFDHGARPPRTIALKQIHESKQTDRHFVELFVEEARVGCTLRHPNIVRIYEFGKDSAGRYFLAMEWVEGIDFHQWLRAHPTDRRSAVDVVLAIGTQVCQALAAAHERVDERGDPVPVYHRDVSPSNIMLSLEGTVKLTDFGLARAMDRATMTRPHVLKGKLAYSAPELVAGENPSAQSDIFSLGVVLWEALAQERMFAGKSDIDTLMAIRRGEIRPLGTMRPELSSTLTDIVHRALRGDPAQRFESARAMGLALAEELGERPLLSIVAESVDAAKRRLTEMAAPRVISRPRGSDQTVELSLNELDIEVEEN